MVKRQRRVYLNDNKTSDITRQLIELLGAQYVLTSPSDMKPYLTENRELFNGAALAIIKPRTATQISTIVHLCKDAGISISPQGGNTGLVAGQTPKNGIVISLARMNTIHQADEINSTITVEAGATLQSVQEAATKSGCLFPLSLASQGSCQIGGNIASNAGGTAVLRYGNMRDLVLGLEVVLPDGRIWNGLRALRKDNAGYDLKQIFIGSEGTLGIITKAVLKLYPAIQSRATAFVGLNSVDDALELFQRTRSGAAEMLSAFELIPRFGLEMVLQHMDGVDPLKNPHQFYALVELSSASQTIKVDTLLEKILESALNDKLMNDAVIATNEAQSNVLWSLRENMSWAQKYEGGSIKHDVSVPVSKTADFIKQATILCHNVMQGIRICAFGHMGDGNIHFNLSQPIGMDKELFLSHWARFNRIVHDLVVSMNGSIAAEHGIGQLKINELAHYKDDVSLDLMRRIKVTLDPKNIMNPSKVII
jgi:FAD/FMN-containing dehydrogenase